MNEPTYIGSPIKVFIKNFIKQAEEAISEEGYKLCSLEESHIAIDLTATEVKEAGASLKIHVFNAGGKIEGSNAQKIKMYAKKLDVEEEEHIRKMRSAELEKTEAETNVLNRKSLGG